MDENIFMDENDIDTDSSALKKAGKLANDAIIITTVVVSVVGLGKLAYDTAEIGAEKFRSWKKARAQKKTSETK